MIFEYDVYYLYIHISYCSDDGDITPDDACKAIESCNAFCVEKICRYCKGGIASFFVGICDIGADFP